jgi:hypothetical protein
MELPSQTTLAQDPLCLASTGVQAPLTFKLCNSSEEEQRFDIAVSAPAQRFGLSPLDAREWMVRKWQQYDDAIVPAKVGLLMYNVYRPNGPPATWTLGQCCSSD